VEGFKAVKPVSAQSVLLDARRRTGAWPGRPRVENGEGQNRVERRGSAGVEHPWDAARRYLTDTHIETAWARGRIMSLEGAVAYAGS
jgi:hypothetical protein